MVITPYTQKFYDDTLANGGATVDLTKHSLPEPEGRYYVGAGSKSWVHKVKVEDFTPQYLSALVLIAKREGHKALGTWVHEGTVFVEPTSVFDDYGDACWYSWARSELAFYDSVERTTIAL